MKTGKFSLIPMDNFDPLGFFRCVVILLAMINRGITRKMSFEPFKNYKGYFKRFVESQYLNLSTSEQQHLLWMATQILQVHLKMNEAHRVNLKNADLDEELRNVQKLYDDFGKFSI